MYFVKYLVKPYKYLVYYLETLGGGSSDFLRVVAFHD